MKPVQRRGLVGAAAIGVFVSACSNPLGPTDGGVNDAASPEEAGADASSSASSSAPTADRLAAILNAEHRRLVSLILPQDQQSRDVEVRRAAARALARIGGSSARGGLLRALADEDLDVVAWGAYGLGFWCKGDEASTASALVARALSLPPSKAGDAARPLAAASGTAIARAIGRCGAETSEPTLVAWLGAARDRAVAAALGLGDLGASKQKLREETLVALLNLAAGSASSPPVPEALFAFTRLENVPISVVPRLQEVASARLAEPGEARAFAVRALGRAGEAAVPSLERVLTSPNLFTPAERADAVNSLKRIGAAGRRVIEQAIPAMAPPSDPVALTSLVGEHTGVFIAAINALSAPGAARKALRDLAALAPPPDAVAAIARRVSWIRCSAAKLVVGSNFTDPLLTACDVAGGSIGARAAVEVIGRAPIRGPRLVAWKKFAEGSDVRAREAAIELIETHDEIDGAADMLALALAAKEPGVVGTAADVLAKQPQRASDPKAKERGKRGTKRKRRADRGAADDGDGADAPPPPSPAIVKALLARLQGPEGAPDPELIGSAVDAAGALGLREARAALEGLCRSPLPTTREHAAKALGLLDSGKKITCDAPPEGGAAPAELTSLERGRVTLTFESDVGELSIELDADVAPVIVTRVVRLAASGYYNGMIVHRVVPGFVTQFGAPFGDGFGGPAGEPPVRCETSPLPFERDRVGIALSGRDTGGSQLFVMHGRAPHLDGGYAIVGSAKGPWASFVDGDALKSVKVSR